MKKLILFAKDISHVYYDEFLKYSQLFLEDFIYLTNQIFFVVYTCLKYYIKIFFIPD